jgi:hypothetical protein
LPAGYREADARLRPNARDKPQSPKV